MVTKTEPVESALAPSVEGPVTESLTQEQATQKTEPETTAKADADERDGIIQGLKSHVSKLESDLRSRQGSAKKQAEYERILFGINDRIEGLEKGIGVLAKGVMAGPDGAGDVLKEVNTVASESRQKHQERTFLSLADEAYREIQKALKGDDGNPLFPTMKEPEIAPYVERHDAWRNSPNRDVAELMGLVVEAYSIAGDKNRALRNEEREKERRERRGVQKKNTNDLKLAGAPGPGGAVVNDDNIDLLYTQGKVTDAAYKTFLKTGALPS